MVCVCHAQSRKAGLKNFAEISQAFLFDTIEIDRNENNWQDSFQTIAVHANDSYKQKCSFFSGMIPEKKTHFCLWYASQTKVKEHFKILSNCSVLIVQIQLGGTNNIGVNVASIESSCCERNFRKL